MATIKNIATESPIKKKVIKCVVWDLDNTLWDGILMEDSQVRIRSKCVDLIKELDRRGILNSISSKNDFVTAMQKLKEHSLDEYFLYPQINWETKSVSIQTIAKSLNIGIDTMAFIDDQEFERDEVKHAHPELLCIDAVDLERIPLMPEMNPAFISTDSANRRRMYLNDIQRNHAESTFEGPTEEFLSTLEMQVSISRAREVDLQRAEELTIRTHQLNTTGYTYSYEELKEFSDSKDKILLIAGLDDKYGTYGKIGLALIEKGKTIWTVKLLLMSCRVMSRGVGSVLMTYIMNLAKENGVRIQAEFLPNEKNRMMLVTYKLSGFNEVAKQGEIIILEHGLKIIPPFPNYIKLFLDDLN